MRISDLLKDFFDGAASVLDLSPLPRRSRRVLSDEEAWQADADAIAGDWQRVGDDLRRAARRKRKDHG